MLKMVDDKQKKKVDVKEKVVKEVSTKKPNVVEDIVDGFAFLSSTGPFEN